MTKLTSTQREVLLHCSDWSAAFEVAERRVEDGSRTDWKRTQDILMALRKRGLVEYGEANATYRITDAGREALGPASRADMPGNARILFGLEAQGHIPVVENMLAGKADWQEIGRAIGWDGETARTYYERYQARKTAEPEYRCRKCGAQADERWDCCEAREATDPSPPSAEAVADGPVGVNSGSSPELDEIPMSRTLKPMEWNDSVEDGSGTSSCTTVFGRYDIWRESLDMRFGWEGPDRDGHQNGRDPCDYDTLDDAKRAAFSHYSARLRELVARTFEPAAPATGDEASGNSGQRDAFASWARWFALDLDRTEQGSYADWPTQAAWYSWCASLRNAESAGPLFWYRPVGEDGLYEGPHHTSSKHGETLRALHPGQWHGLYASTRGIPVDKDHLDEKIAFEETMRGKTPREVLARVRGLVPRNQLPNWSLAMEVFGVGSNYGRWICSRWGIDPDGKTVSAFETPSRK